MWLNEGEVCRSISLSQLIVNQDQCRNSRVNWSWWVSRHNEARIPGCTGPYVCDNGLHQQHLNAKQNDEEVEKGAARSVRLWKCGHFRQNRKAFLWLHPAPTTAWDGTYARRREDGRRKQRAGSYPTIHNAPARVVREGAQNEVRLTAPWRAQLRKVFPDGFREV